MTSEKVKFQFEKKQGSIIKVIGVGGGGGNAVNHMYKQGIRDVDFVICNTDAQALNNSPIPMKVQLGPSLTGGRGAGNKPELGKQAAIENIEDVKNILQPFTKMVFITAGMGGGTGTGAAPVIARQCREEGYLTVGIVTIPFRSEGKRRISQAIEGIREIEQYVDSLLVINNERIREMYGDFPISQAFAKADDVLTIAAKGIAEIITVHGYINVDFADVETVMRQSGVAIMGTGIAEGEGRAIEAIEKALASPLLNNNDIDGARNILLNVTSGSGPTEVTMDEIGEITDYIQKKAGFEADLIWGNGTDESLGKQISVTVIATGFSTTCIPELLSIQKPLKETHTLSDIPSFVRPKPAFTAPPQEKLPKVNFRQSSIDFESRSPQNPAREPVFRGVESKEQPLPKSESQLKIDCSLMTEEEVDNLEKVPAFVRKQMQINPGKPVRPTEYSNYTVSGGPGKKVVIRENNNLYIHKNMD
jgi:cell division protein FtsZ